MSYVIAGLGEINPMTQMAAAEDQLATALRPFHPTIDKIEAPPYLGNAWRNRLKVKPITALLELFKPFENVAKEIILETNRISGKHTRTIGNTTINMTIDQPQDYNLDLTVMMLTRRLRVVTHYMTLIHQDPKNLAAAAANVAKKYGASAAGIVHDVAQQIIQNLPPPPPLPKPFGGLGAVPAVIASALAAMGSAKGAITAIAIAAAPVVVPAIITLILGLTKQASADVKSQQQMAANAKAAAQMAADKDESGFPLVPVLALAAGAYLMTRK